MKSVFFRIIIIFVIILVSCAPKQNQITNKGIVNTQAPKSDRSGETNNAPVTTPLPIASPTLNFPTLSITIENANQTSRYWSLHPGPVSKTIMSPDRRTLGVWGGSSLWLLDMQHISEPARYVQIDKAFEVTTPSSASWAPDGRSIAVTDGVIFALFDANSGNFTAKYYLPKIDPFSVINWIADGNRIAISYTGGIAFYNARSGERVSDIQVSHKGYIQKMIWDPNSTKFVICDTENELLSISEKGAQEIISNEIYVCDSFVSSPKGDKILFQDRSKNFHIWDMLNESDEVILENQDLSAPSWSTDGKSIAFVSASQGIQIFSVEKKELIISESQTPMAEGILSLAWFPDSGKILAFSIFAQKMFTYDITGKNFSEAITSPSPFNVEGCSLNPVDQVIYTVGHASDEVHSWDIVHQRLLGVAFIGSQVWRALPSPDGNELAVLTDSESNQKNKIIILDAMNLKKLGEFEKEDKQFLDIVWISNDELVTVIDNSLLIWGTNGQVQKEVELDYIETNEFSPKARISPNGQVVAITGKNSITFVDTSSWNVSSSIELSDNITDLSWSADSSTIAVALINGSITFINSNGEQSSQEDFQNDSPLYAVAYSTNGDLIAINDKKGDIIILNAKSLDEVFRIHYASETDDDMWGEEHVLVWGKNSSTLAISDNWHFAIYVVY